MAGFVSTPFRLFRFPASLVGLLLGALLLAVAGAASPLFVDSAGNAALQRQVTESGGAIPAFEIRRPSELAPDLVAYRDQVVRRHLALPGVGRPVLGAVGSLATVGVRGSTRTADVRLVWREGAFAHLRVIDRVPNGSGTGGVWLSDRAASNLKVRPGDVITVLRAEASFDAPVEAVYADVPVEPRDPYWTPLGGIIYPANPDDAAPPSFLLVTRANFFAFQPRLDHRAELVWDAPLAGVPTLDQARRLSARLEVLVGELSDETTEIGSAVASAQNQTPLPTWVQSAEATVTSIVTPVETIALAGRGVALAVVIAAGVYIVRRRRVEFALLHARGVAPSRLGARTGVESLLPLAAGTAAGAAAAVGLVAVLGPGPFTSPAVREAGRGAAIAGAVGLASVAASATFAVRSLDAVSGAGRLRGVAARVPWEAIVLALAGAALYETVIRGGEPVVGPEGQVSIDRLLLLFPLLLLAGGAGVAVRGLRRLLPRLRRVRARRSPALYLFTRRLAATPRTAGLLITASALGLGMLAYAGLLTSSIQGSADVKAHVAVGSDVAAQVVAGPRGAPGLVSTEVTTIGSVTLSGSGESAALLAIRPEGFADAAFWDGSFGASPEEILRALGRASGPVPIVLVNGGGDANGVGIRDMRIPITVVRRMGAFPGMTPGHPTVVVSASRLDAALHDAGSSLAGAGGIDEVWAHGDADAVRRRLEAAGASVAGVRSAQAVRETSSFQSVAWTFGFLEALGVAAGLIALVGLVLYLQTRQRAREISYALARRMGLSRGSHRRSVGLELGGMLVTAFAVGAVLAGGAALLVYRRFDPLPSLPPGPVLRAPMVVLAGAGAAILVASWLGARLVQRRADRANVAEVMRAA